jgi:hypothetical protein
MRGISREVLARDAAWTLDDGNCKDLTEAWRTLLYPSQADRR